MQDSLRPMKPKKLLQERELQTAARRFGLKVVLDRFSSREAGTDRYILRPIWDARRAVRVMLDGGCELVPIHCSRRRKATTLTLVGIEALLSRWTEPKACAPARLPWQTGVVAQNIAVP
jgi:hypothetical protein